MLRDVAEGKIQLPDFQRGWVWTDEAIKSLLASVSLSYPIGAVMMLEAGNPDVRFKNRPLEGATPPERQPDFLLLDGQQRMTSLFQALASGKVVETQDNRDKKIKRWYYVDILKATAPEADLEEAFISLPEDRKVLNFRGQVEEGKDYSTAALEQAGHFFPLSMVFGDFEDWADDYKDVSSENRERWKSFKKIILDPFKLYLVPVITMSKSTPKEAVCQVFEKVNTGGVSLTVFELLTATFAADDYRLREAWLGDEETGRKGIKQRLSKYPVLSSVENTDFLQVVALLTTRRRRQQQLQSGKSEQEASPVSCKRKDILKLSLDEYKQHSDAVERGFLKAVQFLHNQKLFMARDLPYRTQLVPLAAALAVLGEKADSVAFQDKLAQWFWCGVFGELYSGATETRYGKDFPELLVWANGGDEPSVIREANFYAQRLDTLQTRNSAAYKGIYALLMKDGAQDFRTGQTATDVAYFEEHIDIHHIFPRSWCEKQGISAQLYDSVINKTPLTEKTNRKIGGNAPSNYLSKLQREEGISPERMDEILLTHVIEVQALRSDDFKKFYKARRAALLERITKAMKKPVV